MPGTGVYVVVALAMCFPLNVHSSARYGSAARGRLSGGVQLPLHGDNFAAYSQVGVDAGRTYVHETVRQVVLDAYEALTKTMPDKTYVYGETGLAHGGPIPPHRTHEAGISVDFMVPVLNEQGRSVRLPSTPSNQFGYGFEFDNGGRILGYQIDFDAMAEHLLQISVAAHRHGIAIERVIFDERLVENLFRKARRGTEVKRSIPFMKERAWIRHDEHYHIDFRIPCLSLSAFRGN